MDDSDLVQQFLIESNFRSDSLESWCKHAYWISLCNFVKPSINLKTLTHDHIDNWGINLAQADKKVGYDP